MSKTVSNGKVISLEYTLKLENDQLVESNVGKEPLTYTHGTHQIIHGVETALEGMEVGETKQAVVSPAEGYGDRDPNAFQEVPRGKLPQGIAVGTQGWDGPVGLQPSAGGEDAVFRLEGGQHQLSHSVRGREAQEGSQPIQIDHCQI
jgi:FKBP-type peptidyl-prolyl cis-trans isomerase SlyD